MTEEDLVEMDEAIASATPITAEYYKRRIQREREKEETARVSAILSPKKQDAAPELDSHHLTDVGNAEMLVELYGNKVRYDHHRSRWLIWRKHRWQPDVDGDIYRMAGEAARERARQAVDLEHDKRLQASRWAFQSESKVRLDAAISIAKSLTPIADAGDNWDTNLMVLSCPNWILNLTTGELRDGRPDDRITMSTGVNFNPEADCLRWRLFINEIFEGDENLIRYVHKCLGYSITGSVKEQVAFFCFGSGANGKSVFFKTISNILGDYAYDAPVSLLQRNSQATNTNDVASTEFRRFLVSGETLSTSKLNEQRIKAWTGGDKVTARFLYKENFTFEPTVKPWLFINHRQAVEDDSYGFWRRVRLIPFNRIFKPEEQDKNLLQNLKAESEGILNWLVKGCLLWQAEELNPTPESVLAATKTYQAENDILAEFIEAKCVILDNCMTKASAFYSGYSEWAGSEGMLGSDVITRTAFGRRMGDKFPKTTKKSGTYYKGIALKSADGVVDGGGLVVDFVPEWWVDTRFTKSPIYIPHTTEFTGNDPKPTTEAKNSPPGLLNGISSLNQLSISVDDMSDEEIIENFKEVE